MADGSSSSSQPETRERISQILDGVAIPINRFCLKGNSYDLLQRVDDLMEFMAAIDAAAAGECQFEMPPNGAWHDERAPRLNPGRRQIRR